MVRAEPGSALSRLTGLQGAGPHEKPVLCYTCSGLEVALNSRALALMSAPD